MDVSQLLADLDTIKNRIWTANVTKMDFETIREKVHRLDCELQVHETLADTKKWLHETKRPNNRYRTKVEKMVMMVHGAEESPGIRFEMLQSLEMETFMFVSASYTVLEIKKLAQDVFDCLLDVAPRYLETNTLPSGWMHRTELQTAVAGYAKSGSAFKRKYQELEYQNPEYAKPSKRSCTEPNTGSCMGQQNESERDTVVSANSPLHEERAMKYMYTDASASDISALPELFSSIIRNSRLWKWERNQGLQRTGTFALLFPKDHKQDVSLTIWCGHDDGYRLMEMFSLQLAFSS